MSKESEELFYEILVEIGDNGKFQKVFNYLYNFIFIIFATASTCNFFLSLAEPDHWCNVPGREKTNYSISEWKNLHIPWSEERHSYEKCLMYTPEGNTTECLHGWEYDHTWYLETVTTKENWVCNRSLYLTNVYTFGRAGEICGTFVLGILADKFGRRPIFYAALTTLFLGKCLMLFSSSIYALYAVSMILGGISGLGIFQSILIIGIEVTREADRAKISFMQCVGWTLGFCGLPMVYWIFRHWVSGHIATVAPLIPFFFLFRYMIESPRWLLSKGRVEDCFKQLSKVAKFNSNTLSEDYLLKLQKAQHTAETNYSLKAFFSSWTMIKISLLTMSGWVAYMLTYIVLCMNVTNLGGNPYMNFFWQALAELPGYALGNYLSDTLGRKYCRLIGFVVWTFCSFLIVIFIYDDFIVSTISVLLKCVTSVVFYAINLQSLEVFPTSLRQSGTSMGYFVGSLTTFLSPYIVHLGVHVDKRLPYIVAGALGIFGATFGFFLPETLNQKLPETLDEVEELDKSQKIWSLPNRHNECKHSMIKNKA